MPELLLHVEPYDGPAAGALTAAVQQEYVERYGGPDETPVDAGEFAPPAGVFLVGYLDGEPVACGGLRLLAPGVAEVKRMFVVPSRRGRGLARRLLVALEEQAHRLGARRVQLETGQRQPEAVQLYETSGYRRIAGYGHYRCAPLSVSFAKDLPASRG